MPTRTLGIRVRECRDKLQLTQHDLARAAGMQQQQISYIEKGLRLPSAPVIVKLSDALGVSTDYLLTGEYGPRDYEKQFKILADLDPEERSLLLDVLKASMKVAEIDE